jgi:hypothetical protein
MLTERDDSVLRKRGLVALYSPIYTFGTDAATQIIQEDCSNSCRLELRK